MCRNYVRNALTSAENIFIQLIQRLKLNFQHFQHIPYKISVRSAHLLENFAAYSRSNLDPGCVKSVQLRFEVKSF